MALHGSNFEPVKLLFDFNADADPDPAFHSNEGPDLSSQNDSDPSTIPDPQPCVQCRDVKPGPP